MKYILNQLANGGIQTRLFYSARRDKVYCKLRAPMKRLSAEAVRLECLLPLDPSGLGNYLREGKRETPDKWIWRPIEIPETSELTSINPYDFIYVKYLEDSTLSFIYKKWANNTIFRGVDRIKLIASIINARKGDGGCALDLYKLIKKKCLLSFFPLHDLVELRELEEKWLRFCQVPWKQRVDSAKDYFGEKIGMYFLWLGHYTTWLISAAGSNV